LINYKDIANKYEVLINKNKFDSVKIKNLTSNEKKINLYQETVTKQQEVIKRFEKVLSKHINSLPKKDNDLNELKKENINLQNNLKEIMEKINSNEDNNYNNNNFRNINNEEIQRLENIVRDLRFKLNEKNNKGLNNNNNNPNKRKISYNKLYSETDDMEMEFKYERAIDKIRILENQIENMTKKYGDEIIRYKIKLRELNNY
jgi:hypothetical protein